MKRRKYQINQVMQKAMYVCMACLILILIGKFAFPRIGRQTGSMLSEGARERSAAIVDQIWDFAYPGRGGVERKEGKKYDLPWMVEVILERIPSYRYQEELAKVPNVPDQDPSFQEYLENHKFLKEYEYLLSEFAGGDMGSEHTDSGAGGTELAANESAAGENMPGASKAAEKQDVVGEVKVASSQTLLPTKTSLPVIGKEYVKEQLADYDFLMKHFYSVHSTTTAGRDLMKADTFLSKDFSLTEGNDKPQILIYHTHSQEEFADYHSGNTEATIANVGEYLTELLRAKGYSVIHDTSVYDLHNGKLDRNKAYTYALDGITRILQENPSIQVVLDVHRDGVKEDTHLVHEVNGKMTAPIMFFNGMCQTPTGPIEYLPNPYREDNLAFSFQMQLYAEAYFPGYTRKIYLKGLRYNQHLRPRSALIEVGAQTNTYEEARNAMEPLAELLDMVLQTK